MLTADIDPHCADIAATQHDCGAITVAASEGGQPAAAVRVATSGVERVGAEERSGARRGSVHGRAARGRGCMGGGMEEAAAKRAAKGAVRARR